MSEIIPSARAHKKNPQPGRHDLGERPTARTIQHDIQVEAYRRGAQDALRAIMLAAQAALAKRESQDSPPKAEDHG